jgi:hypothetical protein
VKIVLSTFGYNVAASLELQASTKSDRERANNRELIAAIRSGARKPPSVTQVVMFNLFKAISNAYPDRFSADHRYYRDKDGYYDDSKVSFWKQMIAKRVVKDFNKEINANQV